MLTLVHLPIALLPFRFMRPVRLRKRNTSSMMRRFVTFLWGNSFNMMLLSAFSVSVLPCNNWLSLTVRWWKTLVMYLLSTLMNLWQWGRDSRIMIRWKHVRNALLTMIWRISFIRPEQRANRKGSCCIIPAIWNSSIHMTTAWRQCRIRMYLWTSCHWRTYSRKRGVTFVFIKACRFVSIFVRQIFRRLSRRSGRRWCAVFPVSGKRYMQAYRRRSMRQPV